MAEVSMASESEDELALEADLSTASESDDELALEVLSGFVKTVYETAKGTKDASRAQGKAPTKNASRAQAKAPTKNASKAKGKAPTETASMAEARAEKENEKFQELLFRAAKALDIENTEVESDSFRHSLKAADRILIPLDSDISQHCLSLWEKPATSKPVDWAMQRKYRGRGDSTILTTSHPPADSVIVLAASGGRTTKAMNFPIPGKEHKIMDSVGKNIYQSGGLGLKEANTAAALGRYNQYLWAQLNDILEALPEDAKNKALELQKEGMTIGDSVAQIALDQADVAARTMATGVTQRRRTWFNASRISPQVEARVLDMEFDGSNLFNTTTEAVLERARNEPPQNVMRRVNYLRAPNKVIRRKAMQPKV